MTYINRYSYIIKNLFLSLVTINIRIFSYIYCRYQREFRKDSLKFLLSINRCDIITEMLKEKGLIEIILQIINFNEYNLNE